VRVCLDGEFFWVEFGCRDADPDTDRAQYARVNLTGGQAREIADGLRQGADDLAAYRSRTDAEADDGASGPPSLSERLARLVLGDES